MTVDKDKIRGAFPGKAWAYAEQIDSVKIGKWLGSDFEFCEPFCKPLDEQNLLELRVFDSNRELKFTGVKFRDTVVYKEEDYIADLADTRYYMYGEHAEPAGGFTKLWEDRGGIIYFPAKLSFPGRIALKLGVRNYARYNDVPILPPGMEYSFGLKASGAGALEVYDYAYTGFYYANGTVVDL